MTPQRQEHAFEIFGAAIALPEVDRGRFVAMECADDQELEAEVRSLLAAHADASGFLSRAGHMPFGPTTERRAAASPALQPRERLGAFVIERFVGAGGMGEVYKARDTRLDRTVAIKLLRSHLASDPVLRQRFEREARAISSLDHPYICALYDVGRHENIDYLVMQYLDGETLAARLARGPLPLDRALKHSIEIADAVDGAHRQGVVHRDLKPGNVMLTRDGAKLLDFGLAKPPRILAPAAGTTGNAPMTAEGTLLGTLQYMAPEQLEGRDADARSDIWAFGCVLYEMLTGRPAFAADSETGVIAAILDGEPPSLTPSRLPRALQHVLGRCLRKDADERWQSARDLRLELEWIAEAPHAEHVQTRVVGRARGPVLALALAAVAIVAAALAAWVLWTEPSRTIAARFDITLPHNVSFDEWMDAPILSPDGRYVAFAASDDGVRRLMVRRLDDRHVTSLAGTEGIYGNPFWSPDGRSVAFFAGRQIKRVAVAGGPVVSVCACEPAYGWGGSWNDEGVILFPGRSGIRSVREDGTGLQSVTRLADGDFAHLAPAFLPDGRHFLYEAFGARRGIYAASLEGGAATRIIEEGIRAQYVADGYVLFTRREALFAQPFDLRARQLRGAPVTVVEDVLWPGGFSASNNGVVAYRPATMRLSRLVWAGRDGRRLSVVSDAGQYVAISLSPSGRHVAIQRREDGNNSDLWLLDQATGIVSRLTTDPAYDGDPVWSPDERRLAFTSNRLGRFTLFQKDLISGKEEPLLAEPPAPGASVDDWSSDGRYVIFRRGLGQAIYSLPMEGEPKPQLIAEMPGDSDQSQLSPNGKWLAFQANESGRWEVYVAAFPGFTEKRQVSTNGGMEPIWRPDGRELFYLDLDGQLMAVPVSTQPAFDLGAPATLFQTGMRPNLLNQYAAARDGQKFLLLEPEPSVGESLTFLLDWPARIRSR
jgi:eukaryotic-like serine/threonine-protein kinase